MYKKSFIPRSLFKYMWCFFLSFLRSLLSLYCMHCLFRLCTCTFVILNVSQSIHQSINRSIDQSISRNWTRRHDSERRYTFKPRPRCPQKRLETDTFDAETKSMSLKVTTGRSTSRVVARPVGRPWSCYCCYCRGHPRSKQDRPRPVVPSSYKR